MDIVVFSDNKGIEKYFASFRKSRTFSLQFYPCADLKKKAKSIKEDDFVYLDIGLYAEEERKKNLQYMSKLKGCRYGIIDEKGVIKDTAEIFHNGASDYIGKEVLGEGITAKRLRKAAAFRTFKAASDEKSSQTVRTENYIPSSNDWSRIKSGQEYTFYLMYVAMDNYTDLKNKLSDDQLTIVVNKFKNFIERTVAPAGGKIWMWNDFSGLILFLFDGERYDAVLACIRLVLSRKIFSAEGTNVNIMYSYCIALHIGNTVYQRRGNTGTIVSDSINAIFHLGKRFLQPGNFYLTTDVLKHAPEGLKKPFVPAGCFEGLEIMRMRLPL